MKIFYVLFLSFVVAQLDAADDHKRPLLPASSHPLQLSDKGKGQVQCCVITEAEEELGRIVKIDQDNIYMSYAHISSPLINHYTEDCPAIKNAGICCNKQEGCAQCTCPAHPLTKVFIKKNLSNKHMIPERTVAKSGLGYYTNNDQVAWVENRNDCCGGTVILLWYGKYIPASKNDK